MAPSMTLLERARRLAGLSRSELARRAGASRPTLAAYASGTKSPNLSTAERIVQAAGFDLDLVPRPVFGKLLSAGAVLCTFPMSCHGYQLITHSARFSCLCT